MTASAERGGGRAVLAAFLVLLAVAAAPIFSTVLPPLVDYPNHLARLALIAAGGNQFYAVRWAPLPDLAADLVVPPLARVMPLALAGKLFLVLTFALLAGGAVLLNRAATGRWRLWPLLAFSLLYSRSFLWGFVNYLFGLGLALVGLALWMALEERPGLRFLVSLPVALACFFAHLAAFGVYAIAIAGAEMAPAWTALRGGNYRGLARRAGLAAGQFLLPAIVLFGFAAGSSGGAFSYGPPWRKADLLFSVFDNYSRPFDVLCFALLVGLIAGLAGARRLTLAPRLGCVLALLTATYLLLPNQVLSGSGADHRLPVALFLLLIAGTMPKPLPSRLALATGIAAIAVFGLRMAAIEAVWLRSDTVYATELAVLDRLPRGARLAVAYPPRDVNAGGIPQLHIATLAAARRGAFVPTIFAYATQQPLALRPPYDALARAAEPADLWSAFVDADAAAQARAAVAVQRYDFIVFADRAAFAVPPSACLVPAGETANLRLFALRHDRSCF